jgi:penicillin V acylase-like amidase (Ntn superfamily)
MMACRGMGAMSPSKMPKGVKKARRDNTDFTQYKEGGDVKSKVNEAGNYTKPELRKRIFNAVKAEATAGTGAGEWSARKAQMVAQRYKKAGGGYRD